MRLIDADAWIEKLSKSFITPNYHPDLGDAFQCMEAGKHNEQIAELIMQIENKPTAYDVDKVVEKPEVCRWAKGLYSFETCWSDVSVKDYKKYAMAFCPKCGKRIEIVKGGSLLNE